MRELLKRRNLENTQATIEARVFVANEFAAVSAATVAML
jgi:hypothetical protein